MNYINRDDIKDDDLCYVYVLVHKRFKRIWTRKGFEAAYKALNMEIATRDKCGDRNNAFQIRCNGRIALEVEN